MTIEEIHNKREKGDRSIFSGEKKDLSPFYTEITEGLEGKKLYREWWDYGLRPSFRMFLNDPSGFFKYRLGARAWVSVYPWTGASLITGVEYYPPQYGVFFEYPLGGGGADGHCAVPAE